jgi:hypothetical protein
LTAIEFLSACRKQNGDILCLPDSNPLDQNLTEAFKWIEAWQEKWSLISEIPKKEIELFLKKQLATNDAWAKKALLTIYAKQTADEQNSESTQYNNSVGFTGVDAQIMSSFAKQLQTKNWLSAKQLIILKKNIKKYWQQIWSASDEVKLLKLVKKARNAEQMKLNLTPR